MLSNSSDQLVFGAGSKMILVKLMLTCLLLDLVWGQDDYCQFTPQHTMCQYTGVGQSCVALSQRGVSDQEARVILDLHNK